MKTYDVVVGASRKALVVPIVDSNGVAIPLYGATALLTGESADLPGVLLYAPGVVSNPAAGLVSFSSIGSLVTVEQMGSKPHATFVCTVKWSDADGADFTEDFGLRFVVKAALVEMEGAGTMMSTNSLVRYYNFATAPTPIRNTLASPTVLAYPPLLRVVTAGAVAENNKLWEAPVESVQYPGGEGGASLPGSTIMFFDFVTGVFCSMQGKSADRAKSPSGWVGIELASAGQSNLSTLSTLSGSIQLRQSLADYTQWQFVRLIGSNDVAHSTIVNFTVPLVNVNGVNGAPDPNLAEGHHVGIVLDPWKLEAKAWVDGVMRATLSVDTAQSLLPLFMGFDGLAVGVMLWTGAQSLAVQCEGQWSSMRVESGGVNAIGSGMV